jgi:hypothetical protein
VQNALELISVHLHTGEGNISELDFVPHCLI